MNPVTVLLTQTLLLCSLIIGCQSANQESSDHSKTAQDGLAIASLAEAGMDTHSIEEIIDSIRSGFYPRRHSVLIYKNKHLVLEEYFAGQDYIWGRDVGIIDHGQTVLHDMRSVSKSVVSACVGIAIDQGKIEGVDQSVFDFFPEYQEYNTGEKAALTIEHLLTMTTGLDWNENVPYDHPDNSEILMDQSDDRMRFVLSRPIVSVPGTEWNYNGGTTELLATILKRATGNNVHEFAKQHLFLSLIHI